MHKKTVLVSACLLGIPTRYDARSSKNAWTLEIIQKIQQNYNIVPFCPEQLAGFSTPRTCIEIVGGDGLDVLQGNAKIITKNGDDVTQNMIHAVKLSLDIAQITKSFAFIGQNFSPSCSCSEIYDGTFSGVKRQGIGIATAQFLQNGLKILILDEILQKI